MCECLGYRICYATHTNLPTTSKEVQAAILQGKSHLMALEGMEILSTVDKQFGGNGNGGRLTPYHYFLGNAPNTLFITPHPLPANVDSALDDLTDIHNEDVIERVIDWDIQVGGNGSSGRIMSLLDGTQVMTARRNAFTNATGCLEQGIEDTSAMGVRMNQLVEFSSELHQLGQREGPVILYWGAVQTLYKYCEVSECTTEDILIEMIRLIANHHTPFYTIVGG